MISRLLFCLLPVLIAGSRMAETHAYPSQIGYGYGSCLTCHYNPLGNGSLSDYGRALAAVKISAVPPWSDGKDEEALGNRSTFLFGMPMPSWLRPTLSYRGLYFVRQLEGDPSGKFIHMRADATVVLKFMDDRLLFAGNLGYAPVPSTVPAAERAKIPPIITREHWVGWRHSRMFGIYVGRMDTAFGIRIPDHDSYSRTRTHLGQNDQVYGVLGHLSLGKVEGGIHLFAGNLLQPASKRQAGGSITMEWDAGQDFRPGFSFLGSGGQYRWRMMSSAHLRLGFHEGSSILGECGLISENPDNDADTIDFYVFFQGSMTVRRGLNVLMTGEAFYNEVVSGGTQSYRVGPGVQYFPWQWTELRAEFRASRSWGATSVNAVTYQWLAQVSQWF